MKIKQLSRLALLTALMGGQFVLAAPSVFAATDITLHKLAHLEAVTEIKNTGSEIPVSDFGTNARVWDKTKDGVVKFTAYKLDESKLNVDKSGQVIADEVAQAIKDKTTLPYGATKVGQEMEVDVNGTVAFDDFEDGVYVFVETTLSGIVTQEAKPLLISLPTTDTTGTANMTAIHVYPKNQIEPVSISFKKYQHRFGETEPVLLNNTQSGFNLYKGEPGSGSLIANSYQTLENATITVTDLTVGKYYFVEESKIDSSKPNYGPESIIYDQDVTNNVNNRLTFEYTSAGEIVFPDNSLLKEGQKVINYQKPELDKEITQSVVGFDEEIDYTITVNVPLNIAKYKTFTVTDTPSADIQINKDTMAIKAYSSTGSELKTIPFTVTETNGKFVIVPTLAELQSLPSGSSIKITYKAKLNKSAHTATDVVNTARLDYDNNVVVDYDDDDASVRTYEATVKKVDGGLFNSSLLKSPLASAKFILAKSTSADKDTIQSYLKVVDGEYSWVTNKADATEFETDDAGLINIRGLNNGHYFFVETKAPTGYALNTNPYSHFEIADANAIGADLVEVTNNRQPDMPITGTETMVLLVGGLAGVLVITAVVKRKADEKENN